MNALLHAAKQVKHGAFVVCRRSQKGAIRVLDQIYRGYDAVRPFRYRPGTYPLTFLDQGLTADKPVAATEVPRIIYAVWSGDNPLTPARQAGLDELIAANPTIPVKLITPANLAEIELPDYPIHPAYHHLSFNHRSDYLRGYLMHHYGGAYCDIKPGYGSFEPLFDALDAHPDKWALGYRELGSRHCANFNDELGKAIKRHYASLIGNATFIMRAHSPLTYDWHSEVNRRMDYYAPLLAEHPGDMWGDNEGYPVFWTALQSLVFQPVCMKYLDRLLIDDRIRPRFTDHR